MEPNRIDANIRCPNCNGQLYPRVLVCDACGLKVEGEFVLNEFGSLTPDELHFIRVFIQCEGRIRDMEAALGVSYPTVKSHLASIKQKLNPTAPPEPPRPPTRAEQDVPLTALSNDELLARLEDGRAAYKDVIKVLRSRKKEGNDGNE